MWLELPPNLNMAVEGFERSPPLPPAPPPTLQKETGKKLASETRNLT